MKRNKVDNKKDFLSYEDWQLFFSTMTEEEIRKFIDDYAEELNEKLDKKQSKPTKTNSLLYGSNYNDLNEEELLQIFGKDRSPAKPNEKYEDWCWRSGWSEIDGRYLNSPDEVGKYAPEGRKFEEGDL